MKDPDLTVVILTFNNAGTLEQALRSVSFAEDILIVDSGSTDESPDIARRFGARVLARPFTNWAEQRNAGLDSARGRWILFLDSDEELDERVARSIQEVTSPSFESSDAVGYEFLIRNYFLGKPLLHGGLDKDYHLRLVARGRGSWKGTVHERLTTTGPIGRLPGIVHHQTGRTFRSRIEKMTTYARARAAEWRGRSIRFSFWRALWEPLRYFLGHTFIRQGLRDGIHGVLWWWLLATEMLLAHFFLGFPGGEDARDARRRDPHGESGTPSPLPGSTDRK